MDRLVAEIGDARIEAEVLDIAQEFLAGRGDLVDSQNAWSAFYISGGRRLFQTVKTLFSTKRNPAKEPDSPVPPASPIVLDAQELEENPRSRSAKLRVAIRTDAPAGSIDAKALGMPMVRGLTV